MALSFFTIASYDLIVQQDYIGDLAGPSGEPLDGSVLAVILHSPDDVPRTTVAHVSFSPYHYTSPGALGWVSGAGSESVHVWATVSLSHYDRWLALLTGMRQASFVYFYGDQSNGAEENSPRDFAEVKLTTETEPLKLYYGSDFPEDKVDALPAELRLVMNQRGLVEPA